MGPETKKRDNDRTNKQKSFISLSAVKTELPSDKINNNNTMIYIYIYIYTPVFKKVFI